MYLRAEIGKNKIARVRDGTPRSGISALLTWRSVLASNGASHPSNLYFFMPETGAGQYVECWPTTARTN